MGSRGPEQEFLEVKTTTWRRRVLGGVGGVHRIEFKGPFKSEILCFYAESWTFLQHRLLVS